VGLHAFASGIRRADRAVDWPRAHAADRCTARAELGAGERRARHASSTGSQVPRAMCGLGEHGPRGARVGGGPDIEGRGGHVAGRAPASDIAARRDTPLFCSIYLRLTANNSKLLN
jgi:hypothetical protein